MVNTNKLKGRLREKGLTQTDIAKELNISQPTINQKLNNLRPMDLEEAEKISKILSINPGEFAIYFVAS